MLYQMLFGRERTLSVTVHERPDPPVDRMDRAENLKFVKDGFDWGAFLVPPAFFLQHGIWLGLFSYLIAVLVLFGAAYAFALPPLAIVVCVGALHSWIAWEADELRRIQLEARGWSMIGQVTGTGLLDCERRFLDGWLDTVPMSTTRGAVPGNLQAATARRSESRGQTPPAHVPSDQHRSVLGSLLAHRNER